MKIEIKIDEGCTEPKIIVVTNRVTNEINEIVKSLSGEQYQMIAGFQDEQVIVLETSQIVRIYASNGKVCAEDEHGTYFLRLRLYELELRLANQSFVRISNGEIINLKKVKGFDLSFAGTICVSLSNGTVTYVSRRYVAKIKQLLGI
ncbi:MAG: LytTR family transcriptional regulator [Eubacterium sp.]|nr:LytTR family transcriptional regulator [Eubacterium sp.]